MENTCCLKYKYDQLHLSLLPRSQKQSWSCEWDRGSPTSPRGVGAVWRPELPLAVGDVLRRYQQHSFPSHCLQFVSGTLLSSLPCPLGEAADEVAVVPDCLVTHHSGLQSWKGPSPRSQIHLQSPTAWKWFPVSVNQRMRIIEEELQEFARWIL